MTDLTIPSGLAVTAALPRLTPRRETLPAYLIALGIALFAAAWIVAAGLPYRGGELNQAWVFFTAFALIGVVARRAGWKLIGEFAEIFGLFMLISLIATLDIAILATTDLPLADSLLARVDLAIGFSWNDFMAALDPQSLDLLSHIYASLSFQPVIVIALLCLTGRFGAGWRFVTAWGISLIATIALFPFFPSFGNFAAQHFQPANFPGVLVMSAWEAPKALLEFRSGSATFGANALEGIVTFPSFHAAGAVLLAWGFGHLRWLRWPMALINAAMIVSAVAIGGHYLVDILAGIAIASAAILLADRLDRRLRTA